jgi:hypothetical protein
MYRNIYIYLYPHLYLYIYIYMTICVYIYKQDYNQGTVLGGRWWPRRGRKWERNDVGTIPKYTVFMHKEDTKQLDKSYIKIGDGGELK